MKIRWTPTARSTYFKVLDYLAENWTRREVVNFINEVENLLNQVTNNPETFQASRKKKNVRKALIREYKIFCVNTSSSF